jgi:Protein of unknown function VcgC/VcgE (DUF2780)
MHASKPRIHSSAALLLACMLACCFTPHALAQPARTTLIAELEQRFGLNEGQVRGALGALLVYVRERLPKPDFDQFAARIPDADRIMQEVKTRGIVTGPLDDMDDYEASLSSLGIGQTVAAQIPPAVLEFLGRAGYNRERDILSRALD